LMQISHVLMCAPNVNCASFLTVKETMPLTEMVRPN
jgi:hypothetical protein